MSTLFIIDIDGTIADAGRRFAEAGPEPSRNDKAVYDVWVRNVQNERSLAEDPVVKGMRDLIGCIAQAKGLFNSQFVYLTARNQSFETVTRKWLDSRYFDKAPLLMRPDDNYQEGAEYKEETIKFLLRLYNCLNVVVIDDDEHGTLEKKCHANGWTLLKARSGGQK